MATTIKRFNWARMASGWERSQAWQQRRKAMLAEFENASSVARNSFASAWSGRITGLSDIAAQAALQRIQTETQAKLDKTA